MIRKFLLFAVLSLAFGSCANVAYAQKDAVRFGSDIHVAAGDSIKDTVCFFCSVRAEGEVHGDVVVFFGNAHLNANAHNDVVVFFGKVRLGNGVVVGQDLVNFFGSLHMDDNSRITKDAVVFFGSIHQAASATIGQDRVFFPFWLLLIPIGILILIVMGIASALRS